MNNIENLLELLALHGGTIVSTASLKPNEIDQARAGGRMYVDSNSLGYVWMPSIDAFPDTINKVEKFEKWFPLDEKLPDKLKNLEWFHKREPTPTSLPSDEEIENWNHSVTDEYGDEMSNYQTHEGFKAWEIGMKQMRSIASEKMREMEEMSLKERLFKLANDFAVAKQGDIAVKLHAIHNSINPIP